MRNSHKNEESQFKIYNLLNYKKLPMKLVKAGRSRLKTTAKIFEKSSLCKLNEMSHKNDE